MGPCAATGIYKRHMLEDIRINGEYFDKDFFYLIEDFDIALRARKRGWKSAYLPDALSYHVRNGSGTSYKYRQYFTFRNRYFLIIKNINIRPYFIFYFIMYDIPRAIIMLLTNRYAIKAIGDVIKYLPMMLEKRKNMNLENL